MRAKWSGYFDALALPTPKSKNYAASNDPVEIAVRMHEYISIVSKFIFDLTNDILAVAKFYDMRLVL